MEVGQIQKDVFFLQGWPQFLTDNSVEEGDFLVFRYDGSHVFDFRLFGRTACDKVNTDIYQKDVCVKEEKDVEEVETEEEEEEGDKEEEEKEGDEEEEEKEEEEEDKDEEEENKDENVHEEEEEDSTEEEEESPSEKEEKEPEYSRKKVTALMHKPPTGKKIITKLCHSFIFLAVFYCFFHVHKFVYIFYTLSIFDPQFSVI